MTAPRGASPGRSAAVAAVVAWGLTPLTARAAARLGVLDRPGTAVYKRQATPVPALGGLAVAIAAGLGTAAGLRPGSDGSGRRAATALGLALAAGAVGVADDVRPRPWATRLAAVAGIGLVASRAGFRCRCLPGGLGTTATVLWVAGVASAFNLTDNMDGLAAGSAATSGMAIATLCDHPSRAGEAAVGAAVAGAATGFWAHNRHPATVYLGDGGALFLGTVLALVSIDLPRPPIAAAVHARPAPVTVPVPAIVPVIVLGLPIFDAVFVTITRLARRSSPFRGGRDHTSHRIAATGLPVATASGALVAVSGALGVAGSVVARGGRRTRRAGPAVAAVVAIGAAAVLARLPADG